jgi:hypothetical protein
MALKRKDYVTLEITPPFDEGRAKQMLDEIARVRKNDQISLTVTLSGPSGFFDEGRAKQLLDEIAALKRIGGKVFTIRFASRSRSS